MDMCDCYSLSFLGFYLLDVYLNHKLSYSVSMCIFKMCSEDISQRVNVDSGKEINGAGGVDSLGEEGP